MRAIERSSAFKGKYRNILDKKLTTVLSYLANDKPLTPEYRDHDLSGNWSGCREYCQ